MQQTAAALEPRPGVRRPDRAMSYWPTPPDIADDLVYQVLQPWHSLGDGVRVLEPSAGGGALCRAIRARLPFAHITAVEPDPGRAAQIRRARAVREPIQPELSYAVQTPGAPVADEVMQSTLEEYLTGVAALAAAGSWEPHQLAVANPPFTLPGRPEAWAEHLLALHDDPYLLAPGALISAVVPSIVLTGRSRLVRAVRALPNCGAEPCDRGAFTASGAKVSTALIWAEKPTD